MADTWTPYPQPEVAGPYPTAEKDGTSGGDPSKAQAPEASQVKVTFPKIVTVRPRKASSWSPSPEMRVTPQAKQIAGQHLGRTSLLIRNTGAQVARVGPSEYSPSWPIAPDGQLTLDSTAAVWAWTDANLETTLITLAEYDLGTGGE